MTFRGPGANLAVILARLSPKEELLQRTVSTHG